MWLHPRVVLHFLWDALALPYLGMILIGFVLGYATAKITTPTPIVPKYVTINHAVEFDDIVTFDSAVMICNPNGCRELRDLLEECK